MSDKEHTDGHKPYKSPKWSYQHTRVDKPLTVMHLGGPGRVPWPDDASKERIGFPGFSVFTEQSVSVLPNERLSLHARQNATLRSSHSVTLLGHDHVNALSNRASNIGSQGAVVLASISKHAPEAVSGRVPGETLVGDRAPVEEDHPKFVESRNKFFNTLVNASNTAKALNGTVAVAKALLGFTNGIGDTSIAALNTLVGTVNTFLGTTAAYVSASKGAGTTGDSIDEPAESEPETNAPVKDFLANEVKNFGAVNDAFAGTGVEALKSSYAGRMKFSDAEVAANAKTVNLTPAEIEAETLRLRTERETMERAFPQGLAAEGDGETHPRESFTTTAPTTRKETPDETRARLATERTEKLDRRVDRVANAVTNTVTTSQNFMGVATGIEDLKAALGSKPKAIGGFAALSDTSALVGAEKDVTMIAKGGVNVTVPAFFSGVSVLSGAGVAINTLFSSSVFGLQGVTVEGGLSAGMSAAGSVQVGSRRKEVTLMGKQVKIGARAKTVDQMASSLRQDGQRNWNPQKQLATQSVEVETDVAGSITLVVPTEATTASPMDALDADLQKSSVRSTMAIAGGWFGAVTTGVLAASGHESAAVVGAAVGASLGLADALARMNEVAPTAPTPAEKQRLALTQESLALQHSDASATLKKETSAAFAYGAQAPKASFSVEKGGSITFKGSKLLMDFSEEIELKCGGSTVLKIASTELAAKASSVTLDGTNVSVE